jgi:hypothetical protein
MTHVPANKLTLQPMASGHWCLEISETIGWDDFPKFAEVLVTTLGGKVLDKAEAVDMRIWEVRFQSCTLRLVYDDYPSAVSLESTSDDGDRLLRDLKQKLESRSP